MNESSSPIAPTMPFKKGNEKENLYFKQKSKKSHKTFKENKSIKFGHATANKRFCRTKKEWLFEWILTSGASIARNQ